MSTLSDYPNADLTNVEANDEQRLIIKKNGNNEYAGWLVALVAYPFPPEFDGWQFVAQLYYSGDVKDLPQGMQYEHTCIYLKRGKYWPLDRDKDVGTSAAVNNACDLEAKDVKQLSLHVAREQDDGSDAANYPATVRIDTDDNDRTRLHIGVKCGNAWCDIKKDKKDPSGLSHPGKKKGKVKGHFDVQYLAGESGITGIISPTDTRGSILPAEYLETTNFDCTNCGNGDWKPAAEVKVENVDDKYRTRYNFTEPTTTESWNKVEMRHETNDDTWAARVTATTGVVQYLNVRYTPNLNGQDRRYGARWRWRDKDESMWVSCSAGCCDISDQIQMVPKNDSQLKKPPVVSPTIAIRPAPASGKNKAAAVGKSSNPQPRSPR
jgi:hypothetical protein